MCWERGACTWWSQVTSFCSRKLRKWHCCLQSAHVSLLQNPEAALRFSVILWGCQRALLDPNPRCSGPTCPRRPPSSGHSHPPAPFPATAPASGEGGKVVVKPNTGCSYRPQPEHHRGKGQGSGPPHDTGPPCALTASVFKNAVKIKTPVSTFTLSRWGAQGTHCS